MECECQTFVEYHFLSFGAGGSRHDMQKFRVSDRDVSKLSVPKDAFSFVFYDRLYAMVVHDGKEVQLISERTNDSPTYYYGEHECLISELEASPNKIRILGRFCASSVKMLLHFGIKESERIIRCYDGRHWEHLREQDVLLGVSP